MTSTSYPRRGVASPDARGAMMSRRTIKAIVVGAYHQHRDLLRNAGSLLATTGVTAVLGAVYWIVAARLFRQQDVGYAAAEMSTMTLLGTIGMFGLGTLLLGELPKRERRTELASAALIACALGSLLLGAGFAILAPLFSKRFAEVIGTPGQAVLFVVGVVLTSITMVFDLATIGIMRGGIQLARNMAFSLIKLVSLPIFAFFIHDYSGAGIVLSWVTGIAFSLLLVATRLATSRMRLVIRPDWGLLRSLGRTAMAHNWLNIAIMVPPAAFPVLVTLIVSPSANAAFYVAFTLSTLLYIIPNHLATVLFAMAAAEPRAVTGRVRFALKLSYALGLPAVIILTAGGHRILSIYGSGYAHAGTIPLWLLALGYVPSVPKALYIAICRASGRIAFAAVILTAFAFMEIAAAAIGGEADGLVGLSLGILAALTVQGISITPPILRAIMRQGRHRKDISLDSVDSLQIDVTGPASYPSAISQRAGIDALIAIASAVSTGPIPVIASVYPADYDLVVRNERMARPGVPHSGMPGRGPERGDMRGNPGVGRYAAGRWPSDAAGDRRRQPGPPPTDPANGGLGHDELGRPRP